MKQFPDLYFVFLSNNVDTFREMVGDTRTSRDNSKLVSVEKKVNDKNLT